MEEKDVCAVSDPIHLPFERGALPRRTARRNKLEIASRLGGDGSGRGVPIHPSVNI
jgi:hypothetical protein